MTNIIGNVPHFGGGVSTDGEEVGAIWGEGEIADAPIVSEPIQCSSGVLDVPEGDGRVVGSGREPLAIGRGIQDRYEVFVCDQ